MDKVIGVVIVTFNRLPKLIKTLKAYSEQTLFPKYIIVVNNASSDNTDSFLAEWMQRKESFCKYVINLPKNVGGSGGFYAGQKKALELDAEWIMLADDDAYPSPNYIEGMQQYIQGHKLQEISAICGSVLERNRDGLNNFHRGYLKNLWSINYRSRMSEADYREKSVEIDCISYVGIVINIQKMREVGLVEKDYFIWNDDIEHCIRLRKVGKLICIPQYIINHDCDAEHMTLSWKTYYGWRNQINMFKRHFFIQFLFITSVLFLKTCLLPLKGNRFVEMRLRFTAIKDGVLGNLGISKIYKPGWKPYGR